MTAEYIARIRFTAPSLGAAKRKQGAQTLYAMLRDSEQRILYSSSWWRSLLTRAAKLLGDHTQRVAGDVRWNPSVAGEVGCYRRYLTDDGDGRRRRYALHEAFLPGQLLAVGCLLPAALSVDDFWRLLETGGAYYGISPFVDKSQQYGTFTVVSILPSRPA